jgi:predicted DNA-binding transcriptional regulator AlpA
MARQFVRFKELHERGVFHDRMDAARKVAAGFPKPIEMGPNSIAWDLEEVDAWLASRPRRQPKTGARQVVTVSDAEAV